MGKIIGIDLSTTSSCVAILENDNVEAAENAESTRTTPSIIVYTNDNGTLVGQPVKRQVVTSPQSTLYVVRRLIGRHLEENMVQKGIQMMSYSIVKADNGDAWVEVKGQKMAPPQISAKVLKKMKKTVENYLGEPVTEAVITVPVYFNSSQRQATKDAGRIAGLDVKRIINESAVTALAYGLDKARGDHIMTVYGLGGGTSDASMIEIAEANDERQFEALAISGDTPPGGESFDICLIDYPVDEFREENDISLKGDPLAMQCLKETVEKAKIELPSTQQTDANLSYVTTDANGPKHLNVKVSRAKLEPLVKDLVQHTIEPCRTALKDAGLDASDIHEVILVGDQTRMSPVRKTVAEFFGKEVRKGVDPDEAAIAGVAIQDTVLAGDVRDTLLLDVTPLTLGIEILGGAIIGLIEKNTTTPTRKPQVFFTVDDNQGVVTTHVLQGERKQVAQNKSLGKFDLVNTPPASRGVLQIEVTFSIDVSGILHALMKDKTAGEQQSVVIKISSGLPEDEIRRMVHDTETNAEEDRKSEELAAVHNQGDALVHATRKMITEADDKATAEDKATIEKALGELEAATKGDDEVEIEAKTSALSQASIPLAQKMYAEQTQQGKDASQGEQTKVADDMVDVEFEEIKDNKQAPACFCPAYRPGRCV